MVTRGEAVPPVSISGSHCIDSGESTEWHCEHCGEKNDIDRDGNKCGYCNTFRLRRVYEDLAGG